MLITSLLRKMMKILIHTGFFFWPLLIRQFHGVYVYWWIWLTFHYRNRRPYNDPTKVKKFWFCFVGFLYSWHLMIPLTIWCDSRSRGLLIEQRNKAMVTGTKSIKSGTSLSMTEKGGWEKKVCYTPAKYLFVFLHEQMFSYSMISDKVIASSVITKMSQACWSIFCCI